MISSGNEEYTVEHGRQRVTLEFEVAAVVDYVSVANQAEYQTAVNLATQYLQPYNGNPMLGLGFSQWVSSPEEEMVKGMLVLRVACTTSWWQPLPLPY
jgi:hypothetical protein